VSRNGRENLLSLFAPPRLLGPFCYPRILQSATLLLLNPHLVIHDTQPQDPRPPLNAPPGDLDLPLNQHPIVKPGPKPPQVEPIPTADNVPKVSAIRREVRRVFQEEGETWAARFRGYTMQGHLFALLQAYNESITWKLCMWDFPCGVLKFSVNSSMDTLPTFSNLRRWRNALRSIASSVGTSSVSHYEPLRGRPQICQICYEIQFRTRSQTKSKQSPNFCKFVAPLSSR
jgi:hypothetical protein